MIFLNGIKKLRKSFNLLVETFTKKEVKKDLIEFEVILQILRIL